MAAQRKNYNDRYLESTQETLIEHYAKRETDPSKGEMYGQPLEDVTGIVYRVASAVALAELKYVLTPGQIVGITLSDALRHPRVKQYTDEFADHIGRQVFWANTPANINADPDVSLSVLKYWANGILAKLNEVEIWEMSDELRKKWEGLDPQPFGVSVDRLINVFGCLYRKEMGRLASELKGKGCLAACGVVHVEDSLDGIQETARIEALAAKASMGMGVNTSTLRPWSSLTVNGAAASGPDRFYGKSIAQAVEAVAQGGRRGGALIEIRNSDHPDILFFIEKKKLIPKPREEDFINENMVSREDALEQYGKQYAKYLERQNYLRNTNITVLAMPGFMKAVREKKFYPAMFQGKPWFDRKSPWINHLYDPRKPVMKPDGTQLRNNLTKEPVFEKYSVCTKEFPEAMFASRGLENETNVLLSSDKLHVEGYFYAPDVFKRITEGMRDSGEPGIAFYGTINDSNANNHVYDLNTCNPCGEQFLPAGPGKDGRYYMGNCNLSSMNAAHADFLDYTDEHKVVYRYREMQEAVKLQQRFMDNVTDVSWYPIPAQNMTARMERRNGGGFAGVAEYLSILGYEFGSAEALDAVYDLYKAYNTASLYASTKLADERGPYPLWKGSRFERNGEEVRNSCMTNNAPTGTLAQALQTTWGIEPHNGIVFSRQVRNHRVKFVAPGFEEKMRLAQAWPETPEGVEALFEAIYKNGKSVQGLPQVPLSVQRLFKIRVEITPEQYIKHLAAIHDAAESVLCGCVFNSVSNTCSIPADTTLQAVHDAVMLAHDRGVKDITFYPDGSRLSQPIEKIANTRSAGEGESGPEVVRSLGFTLEDLPTPHHVTEAQIEEIPGVTWKIRVGSPEGVSTLHVTLNHVEPGRLLEVYARMGKPGAVESGLFEAIGRLSSTFLQYANQYGEAEREKVETVIIKQLANIQSGYPAYHKFSDLDKSTVIQSPCDGLAKAIQRYRRFYNGTQPVVIEALKAVSLEATKLCVVCGGIVIKTDGCEVCVDCGKSRCE